MRALVWHALRAASVRTKCHPPRTRPTLRLSYPRQPFHTSPCSRAEGDSTPSPLDHITQDSHVLGASNVEKEALDAPDEEPETPPRPKDPSNYGSASRRAGRNLKRALEIPRVHIPPWFWERNVVLREGPAAVSKAPGDGPVADQKTTPRTAEESSSETDVLITSDAKLVENIPDYALGRPAKEALVKWNKSHSNIILEVHFLIQAGLQVPQNSSSSSTTKPHILLLCPEDGGSWHLENLVRAFSRLHNTDFMRLNAQDIAEIGGNYMEESLDYRAHTLSSLGYDAPQVAAARASQSTEESAEEDEYDEAEEDYTSQSSSKPVPLKAPQNPGYSFLPVASFVGNIQDLVKSIRSPDGASPEGASSQPKTYNMRSVQIKDDTPDLKMTLLTETLLNVSERKRRRYVGSQNTPEAETLEQKSEGTASAGAQESETAQKPSIFAERKPAGLIVMIEDYQQINSTVNGGKFLDKLHEVISSKRSDGEPILIIGTASGKDLMPPFTYSAVSDLQNESRYGPIRTVFMPISGKSPDSLLVAEQKRKIREVNLRHLRDMLGRIAPDPSHVDAVVNDWDMAIDSKIAFVSGLEESVWTMDQISRAATLALGGSSVSKIMEVKHIEGALQLIDFSDSAKEKWVNREKSRDSKRSQGGASSHKVDQDARMRKLRAKCNSHEKKLLNGVIDANSIRTTFDDVRAPPETIEALKTLTSLSLVRPDAFTYGVLATDRIPGLLLYGPPGTGKTLLAKAVAKESGATVLEVSGSDVYDMYVGEGEKNVKAIFTLAKKLSPCIVFIDEADAILGSRSSGGSRNSHRELINQFLREWDGMTDFSAFIMVATNRPFDLDEASLRRLPRRLLVDLPMEKDREEILKLHLKDEVLDPEVSIPKLASDTPFYSGSDLKNLAVAAALACVREEFDSAAAHNKESPNSKYEYPEKRTLHPRHFSKAIEEISASISEDMGSLSAIRKFDEKYGDRRGRRKKLGGYGFKTGTDTEKMESDAARVRNRTR